MKTRQAITQFLSVFLILSAAKILAAETPAPVPRATGTPLTAKWEYSTDGGKTFAADIPVMPLTGRPDNKNAVVARATFKIDDPTRIGGLKLTAATGKGGFALTDADSIQRRYVASFPTLLNMKLSVNDKETNAGLFPCRLYEWVVFDPPLFRKGENTLTVSAIFWITETAKGPTPAELRLETLPADQAALDRGPTLGAIGEDFFSFTARALIESDFSVTVKPLDPAGPETQQKLEKTRLLRAKIPIPKGTRKFSYTLNVNTGSASKTYGPFEVAVPVFGDGFRFVVAANTYVYGHHTGELQTFLAKLPETRAQIFIHGGVFQNVATHDQAWTDLFFNLSHDTLARMPMLAVPGYPDMYSPIAFSYDFYFSTGDGLWDYWTQSFGKVRLIAIEAISMMDDKGRGLKWLEETLKNAKEDYIIVFNSQVPDCSGQNAKYFSKQAVSYIDKNVSPLLVKHKVTATIGSYHYVYERSEPPADKSVTTIMTSKAGGLGWPLREDMRSKNTSSKVAVAYKNHYCLFDVTKDALLMQAIAYETGEVIDKVTFLSRNKK